MAVEQSDANTRARVIRAVSAGIVLAAFTAFLALSYALQSYGAVAVLALAILCPVLPGFVVGLLVGNDGDKWASISAGLFVFGMAIYSYMLRTDQDPPSAFLLTIGIGVAGIGLSAIMGKLGEMTAELPALPRRVIASLAVLLIVGIPVAYSMSIYLRVRHFHRDVLPAISQRFSDEVIRVPADAKWKIDRVSFPVGRYHYISATTELRGHRLYVRVSPDGEAILLCHWSYEPPKPLHITDERTARNYLREFGASERVVSRLKVRQGPGPFARSWFCLNALVPHPLVRPCVQEPSCNADLPIVLLKDGSIRLGHSYYRSFR
jgi:hypothetical protein